VDRKFCSILDELNDYTPRRDTDLFIESRAMQVIASFSHLVKLINESYDEDTAADLTKRLINAARTGDEAKFSRKMKIVREGEND
jgi:hypothetical protein